MDEAEPAKGCLIMAAISCVFTVRRAARMLGRDEDLLWDLLDQIEPEDGLLWVYDVDLEVPAFSERGMETLREIIIDQIDKTP
jgi:hypothetical protein